MDWTNWQTYAAPGIVLITVLVFVRRWLKARESGCCHGRCGCAVSKREKKQRVKESGL
ncbi:MAG: hypothetical protein KJO21_02350 [Verrucomicrobiae bacterium]|nr:hypothetical protein [Verrucomicrobiae bacterium]NNJ44141.1 hypothetical protein [Akkermansiaceae bacterium]